MKGAAGLCLLVLVTAAVALPMQWVELQPAADTQKSSVFGDVYDFCNKSLDPLRIMSVTLSPDPPEKGKNLTVSVRYSLTEEVTGGEVKVSVKYGIIPVFSDTLALCDVLKDAKMSCPLKPESSASITLSQEVPGGIPGGHYTGKIETSDQKGTELACIELDLHF